MPFLFAHVNGQKFKSYKLMHSNAADNPLFNLKEFTLRIAPPVSFTIFVEAGMWATKIVAVI